MQSPILPSFTSFVVLVELHGRGNTWLRYFFLPLPHRNSALLMAKKLHWVSSDCQITAKYLFLLILLTSVVFWITASLCGIFTTIYLAIAPAILHNIKNCWQNVILSCICLWYIVQNVCLHTFNVILTDLIIWLVIVN